MTTRRGGRRSIREVPAGLLALVAVVAVVPVGAALLVARGGDGPPPAAPPVDPEARPANASVVEVVDGDTLVVHLARGGDERLRLIGIDTPESVATDRPDECFGTEASAQLARLVPVGTRVQVERDVEPRDRYDRLLGYVYRSSDGLFVNHEMVEGGFAEAKAYEPNTTHESRLEAAEAGARAADAGLWGVCGSPDVPL
jgi:micrococcal nuclease